MPSIYVPRIRKPYYSAEQDAKMLELWAQGYTFLQIGNSMGMSRNAVCGRLSRLDAPKRNAPLSNSRPILPKSMKPVAAPKPKAKPMPVQFAERKQEHVAIEIDRDDYDAAPALFDGKPLTLASARDGACRWIAGEPTVDAILCGHQTKFGHIYCEHHHKRAYQPMRPYMREPKYG